MKLIKKMLIVFVAALMVMSLTTKIYASEEETKNTITVDVNFKGQVYTLYKLFNATVNDERKAAIDTGSSTSVTTEGIAYTLIDETDHSLSKEFTVTKADGTTAKVNGSTWFEYVNASSKNIKAKNGADITTEEFRLWAKAYGVQTGTALTASEDNDTNIKWTGLDDGYYFISTTTGSLVTVDSVAPNAIVKDKNTVPTVDKTVEEDSTETYQKQNDAEIGQTVNYKTIIHAKKGGTGYKLMDIMSTGLQFDGIESIVVYKGSVAEANIVSTEHYTAASGGQYSDTETATFNLTFKQSYLDGLTDDTDLIVTYTATITADAVINTPIPNRTVLEYGNNTKTTESQTNTFVWGIDLLKKDQADNKPLKDAEFVIYKTTTSSEGEATSTSIYYAKFDSNNKFAGWTEADSTAVADLVKKEKTYFEGKNATVLKTGNEGTFAVTGLDEGNYFLLEVTAPAGYNKLDAANPVTISSTVATAGASLVNPLTSGTNGSTHIEVPNAKGAVLPSTGGIGTTIFHIAGAALVLGAGILLISKKRMNNN